MTLIDSAPPSSIRVIRSDRDVGSHVDKIAAGLEDSTLDAMSAIGEQLGLGNLAVLYERAFLLVEGDTEVRCIPILYEKMFGTRMRDDGIRLINIESCGSWRSVVKVLLAGRAKIVHLLLDADCRSVDSTAMVTPAVLEELSIEPSQVTFIGAKEFEDAFDDEVWCLMLDRYFPRSDEMRWQEKLIADRRGEAKFSEAMVLMIRAFAMTKTRNLAKKPSIGGYVGESCPLEHIPAAIRAALDAARSAAGLS